MMKCGENFISPRLSLVLILIENNEHTHKNKRNMSRIKYMFAHVSRSFFLSGRFIYGLHIHRLSETTTIKAKNISSHSFYALTVNTFFLPYENC